MNHKRLNNLIHTKRYSGVPLVKEESVADHVWGMLSLAYEYIPDINKQRIALSLKPVDIKELVYKITIHDIDEVFSTDIIRTFKHHDPDILAAIDRTVESMMRETLDESFVSDILNAKDDSLEGFYVKIFDFIQAGLKMKFETRLGNKFMKNQLSNVVESLSEIRESLVDKSMKIEHDFITKFIVHFKSIINE